jgi:quinol monooxygenase YgiN
LILVTGHISVAPEKVAELRPHIQALVAATRKEDGCLLYAFAEDINDPGTIRIVERWRDWPSLEAHGKAPHMAPWAAVAKDAGITSREVIAHAAGEEKIL